jgi:hypothetical protein
MAGEGFALREGKPQLFAGGLELGLAGLFVLGGTSTTKT